MGWEKAKLARKCLQAPCVLPSAGASGIRARGQLCDTAVLRLSSPGVFGVPGLHCSSQKHPSGSYCFWWVLFHKVGLVGSWAMQDSSQLCNEMLEHPRCLGWDVYSLAVPGDGELMVLPERHQLNQKRNFQIQSIPPAAVSTRTFQGSVSPGCLCW